MVRRRIASRIALFPFTACGRSTDNNGVLYEQVLDVNCFSLLGPLFLLLSLLLLSTGFVFAL